MKKLILLSLLILVFSNSFSQIIHSVGDTISLEIISFENQVEYISIDTSSQNIWQIGTPSKEHLDSAFSPTRAIMTDTLNNYPVNNRSYFDIVLIQGEPPIPSVGYSFFLSFTHKFESDKFRDGGFVSVSFDNGETWTNVIENFDRKWTYYDEYPGTSYLSSNLYDFSDSLMDNNFGFSGDSDGWIVTNLAWHMVPSKKSSTESYKQIVRFNFISDSIETNKEGWLIDDIILYAIDIGSEIKPTFPTTDLQIYPNPISGRSVIEWSQSFQPENLNVYDLTGRIIYSKSIGNANNSYIDRSDLEKGVLVLELVDNEGKKYKQQIIVL